MGHKVHPMGFRLGVIRDWQAKWYADKHYKEFLQEDLRLRKAIASRYADAAVSLVEIERQANQVTITINTARPGIVIGRGGQRVDETKRYLEKLIGKRVQLNIHEIQQPELDAYLVAKNVADQIERRIAYRRAMRQVLMRTMQAGAKGMKVSCAGRLGGAEIARRMNMHEGQVPLHTLRADIDYGFVEARTNMGRIGVKVWIYKGEILPEVKVAEVEEEAIELVADISTLVAPAVDTAEVTGPVAEAPKVEAEATEAVAEKPAKVKAKAIEAVAEKPAKVKEKVAKAPAETAGLEDETPKKRTRRTTKKAAAAEEQSVEPVAEKNPAEESSTEVEGTDVTTEAS